MADDLDTRLAASLKLRQSLQAEQQKLIGRYEAATAELSSLEKEIREKGYDPSTLEAELQNQQARYAAEVADFEQQVRNAQQALAPFMENVG